MASIREVAKLANVASATVSRYLNGTTPVSDDKRERIENAMRERRPDQSIIGTRNSVQKSWYPTFFVRCNYLREGNEPSACLHGFV